MASTKKTTTNTPKAQETKATTAGSTATAPAKKAGLRKPQVRILALLAKSKKALTRRQISEGATVDNAFCTEYLGSNDGEVRARNDSKFKSLRTLGLIKAESSGDEKDTTVYTITAKGREGLKKAQADE